MKMVQVLTVLLYSWVTICVISEKTLYTGHKLLRLTAEEPEAKELASWLNSNRRNVDVWSSRRDGQKTMFDVKVTQDYAAQFQKGLNKRNLEVTTLLHDLQEELDRQETVRTDKKSKQTRSSQRKNEGFDADKRRSSHIALNEYHPIEEIYRYLNSLPQRYSNTSRLTLGRTVQDRNIKGVYIGDGYKRAVVVECGIHAREWITPATCVYILDQLLNDPSSTIRQRYDWLVIPVINPDGYSYTWTHDRLHRKNMNHYDPDTRCGGVDLNRNSNVNFGGEGASTNPCDETYCGPSPFSERETSGEAALFHSMKGNLTAFFSLHSYSQVWMIPYAYTKEKPVDYDEMERVAKVGVAALEATHGTHFKYGTTYEAVYPSSGGNRDWTYKNIGTIYTYGLEMRDTGKYGFLLPEEQILDAAEETWNGIKAAVLAIPYKD